MKKQSRTAKTQFVIGNWKCTKSLAEARQWVAEFKRGYQPVEGVEVAIAPPLLLLAQLAELFQEAPLERFSLVAQDVSPFPRGSYTGATAADMLKGLCRYAIVGHSERRRYFHETAQDAVNKVSEAADASLIPIICVDEKNAMSQLTALGHIDCDHLIIAYSPVDGQSYREPQYPEKVAEVAKYISQVYPSRSIIYGGGISLKNYEPYLSIEGVSGLFLGEVSLRPESFLEIVKAVQSNVPSG